MNQSFQLEKIFPLHIRETLKNKMWQNGLEEVRVRIGQPLEFVYDTKSCYMKEEGSEPYRIAGKDIAEMLNYISHYSLYAYREEMRQGYITIEGGHRIGLAGSVAIEHGKITGVHHVSFLNIRIAHEKIGCAEKILPFIRHQGSIHNTLMLSIPGAGKTTYLRDSIRMLSEGGDGYPGMKVCVVDERSEIAACHMGVPQNSLGPRTDVLDGCGKAEGMLMLIRSMSPQVLAVDELGKEEDFTAVEQAVHSGSRVIGTIHAEDIRGLLEKPYLHKWMEKQVFRRYIWIQRKENGGRRIQIYDEHMERLC
ncbi:MAG: stage III sporulation protein AA [Clostridiales bacterium]|nr:stage III sporulation protein AA [Clostridiales bacterium]